MVIYPAPLVFVFLGLLVCSTAEAATTVWIDTDPALGAPWREVDDAFALVLAFHSPELRIAGISTTYGNAPLKRTTAVARELVRRFGGAARLTERDAHAGAASPGGGAQPTAATEALALALQKGRLTYIALGPLTNLATFLQLHPELSDRIERVIFIGGRSPGRRPAFGPADSWRVHDANVSKDRASIAVVLGSSIPITLAPIEIARQLAFTPEDMRALGKRGAAGKFLFQRTRPWEWFWTRVVHERGGLVFDVLAILPVLQPPMVATETRFAQLDDDGELIARRARRADACRVQFETLVRPSAKARVLERLATPPASN